MSETEQTRVNVQGQDEETVIHTTGFCFRFYQENGRGRFWNHVFYDQKAKASNHGWRFRFQNRPSNYITIVPKQVL